MGKIEKRLLIIHILVFVGVLATLAVAVFAYFQQSLDEQIHNELSKLVDSVISSIDFDEVGRHDAGKPDAIASVLPDDASQSLQAIRMQWFDRSGRLSANKGRFPCNLKFSPRSGFSEQLEPHALILTRPAIVHGNLLGYARVAHPLADRDQILGRLVQGLLIGILLSAVMSTAAISWLVKQSMIPISEMVRRLKRFTSDASHELRNPLMAIKANADVALKYSDGMRENDREKFEAIADAAAQMNRLTENLLSMAQLEDSPNAQRDRREMIDVRDLCLQLVELYRSRLPKSTAIETVLPDSLPLIADRSEVMQLFENILSNAVQYTPESGTISIEGRKDGNSIVVTIEDSGIGIAAADLPKIFDRFWRADQARVHRDNGNGLGLAIAKSVTEKYGGSITAESQQGVGSQFVVTLPTKPG